MSALAYVNPVSNALFKVSVGVLSDSGTSFQTSVKPTIVVKYTPGLSAGYRTHREHGYTDEPQLWGVGLLGRIRILR